MSGILKAVIKVYVLTKLRGRSRTLAAMIAISDTELYREM
jgi:hypothetical protein